MFGYNDNITLQAVNSVNIYGDGIPFTIKFPIEKEYLIPKNIIKTSIFEYDILNNYGTVVFNIYIGNVSTYKELLKNKENDKNQILCVKTFGHVNDVNQFVVYFESEDGKYVLFDRVSEKDIVVKDIDEFRKILTKISFEYSKIQNSIDNIKCLSYRNIINNNNK